MKKQYSILDVIDPLGQSDTDDRDVYQLRGKQVVSKTLEVSEIGTYVLPNAAKEVVCAQGFYTTDGNTFYPIKVATVGRTGITLSESIPTGATGFLSISFTRKSKDTPMAKYIALGAIALMVVGTLVSYSPELMQLAFNP